MSPSSSPLYKSFPHGGGSFSGDSFAPSAVVIVPAVPTVYISGVTGDDENGVFPEIDDQIRNVFKKVEVALLKAIPEYGSAENAWASIFEVTVYHIGSLPDHLPLELELANKYFGSKNHPTWTSCEAKTLFDPRQWYEMHVKAVAPSPKSNL
ncbi:hypothetical protein T439DRAFT_351104 [Meredithblackwellia eburnea MCA 4105]